MLKVGKFGKWVNQIRPSKKNNGRLPNSINVGTIIQVGDKERFSKSSCLFVYVEENLTEQHTHAYAKPWEKHKTTKPEIIYIRVFTSCLQDTQIHEKYSLNIKL